jgi:toxin ParE1/3/4
MRSITFAESAIRDLEAVRDWYASRGAPAVGERLVADIVEGVERLAAFPESGRIVPEFDTPRLRELIHPPFRIVYRLDADCVRIVRVWRSERLLDVPEDRA